MEKGFLRKVQNLEVVKGMFDIFSYTQMNDYYT